MIRNVGRYLQVPTVLLATVILSLGLALGANDAPKKPDICNQLPPGWRCVTVKELVADTEYHLDLREQVARYRTSSRRFGLTIGFGLGVGGVVDDDFQVRWVPTGGAMIVWGIRFP